MSTQPPQPPKLSQCRKCSEKGFQKIMIYFVQTGFNKSTGKPFWDLKNQDGTPHSHISPMVPSITTTPGTTAPPTITTVPVTKQNRFEDAKTKQIQELHDTRVQVEREHIQAINNQTTAIRELAASIKILVTSINNRK